MRRSARNGFERAVQVLRWLIAEYDLPKDTRIELVEDIDKGETFGELVLRGSRFVVVLSKRACRTRHDYVYNTIHEAAHLYLQQHGLGDLHGPAFWQQFGAMVDGYDHHGHLDSRSYPVD